MQLQYCCHCQIVLKPSGMIVPTSFIFTLLLIRLVKAQKQKTFHIQVYVEDNFLAKNVNFDAL